MNKIDEAKMRIKAARGRGYNTDQLVSLLNILLEVVEDQQSEIESLKRDMPYVHRNS